MTYLHLFQTSPQNVGTSLLIHNQRSGKSECELALIKLAFLLSKSQILKTYAQLFKQEWRTCNLRLKRRRLNKNKYYPFELENTVKTAFVSMESIFERDFLKIYTAFEKSTRGKWKMDLFSNRLCLNFENRLSRTTLPFSLKTSGRSCIRKWPGIFADLSELFGLQVGLFYLFVGYNQD